MSVRDRVAAVLTAAGIASVTIGVALAVSVAVALVVLGVLVLALGIALAVGGEPVVVEQLDEPVVEQPVEIVVDDDGRPLDENPTVAEPLRFSIVNERPR